MQKESPPNIPASYEAFGFCSTNCFNQFWQRIFDYPVEYEVGTDTLNFNTKLLSLWNSAIANSTAHSNPNVARALSSKVNFAINIQTSQYIAFPYQETSNKNVWMFDKFRTKAQTALAKNLESCGRTQDSAKVYEELHMYDKARELREKDRQILVKKTDVSVNLNALLQQVKEGGIVAVFRCPHCGGKLKISNQTTLNSLRKCEHCDSEIESMDLADFLKTVIS
jgi:hypothetical protein